MNCTHSVHNFIHQRSQVTNFTCMHEYPPPPKKKFPPIDPSFDSILFHKIHQKEISIIVYYLLNNSIFNLSPLFAPFAPQIHSTQPLIRHFHSSLEREEVYTQFQASRPRISFDRGNRLSAKAAEAPPRSNIFHPRFFQSKSKSEKSEKGRDVDFPIYISDRSTSG